MIFSDVSLSSPSLGSLSLVSDPDASGVRWRCPMSTIDGWWGSPAPTMETRQRPRGHGVWVAESWLPGRAVSLRGWCEGSSRQAVQGALDRLVAATSAAEAVLTIADSGLTLSAGVRRSGEVLVKWGHSKAAMWTVQLLAPDPRKLGAALTATTGLPSTSGGLTMPFTLPKAISAAVVSGQVSLTNPGTIDGPVILRIDGPITAPMVTHVNSGRAIVFASSLSLSAGEYLQVDMRRREVLAQGQSSRAGHVTERGWSAFQPGANTWAFAALAGTGTLSVTASPAWM